MRARRLGYGVGIWDLGFGIWGLGFGIRGGGGEGEGEGEGESMRGGKVGVVVGSGDDDGGWW